MASDRAPSESRRIRSLAVMGAILAVGVGCGVVGSLVIRSPSDAALDGAAPVLPPASAVVEMGVLGDSLVVDAEFSTWGDLNVPAANLEGVVTAVPTLDGSVEPGTVLLEVSGRPLFLVPGEATVYRDFTGGVSGADVTALQAGLAALGYDVGPADGVYGARTAAAVQSLYHDAGYAPPPAQATAAEVRAAAAQVASERAALHALEEAAASSTDIAVAAANLALAVEALATTQNASLTPLPATEVMMAGGASYDVVRMNAVVGGPASQGLIVLAADTARTLWAEVPRSVASGLTAGLPVSVTVGGQTTDPQPHPGTVSWIAASVGMEGVRERFGDSASVSPDKVGVEITLTSPIARTDGNTLSAAIDLSGGTDATLIVPTAAIRTAADGRTTVTVLADTDGGEELVSVEVTVLDSMAGRTSVLSSDLTAGDRVVIS